jgi:filamin
VAGEANPFVIGSHDKFDNECVKGGADVKASLKHNADASVVVTAEIEDEQDGTYQASYPSIKKAGKYTLTPTIKNENVKGAPFTVVVHAAEADAASFTWDGPQLDGDGNQVVVAGTTEKFTVTARDRFGNQAEAGGLNINGKIHDGPAEVEVKTADNGNGTYTLSYTPTKSGQYKFTVSFEDKAIGGHKNPFGLKVIPAAAYGPTSVASGDGIKKGTIGDKNELDVQSRDRFDNVITKGGAKVGGKVTHQESNSDVALTVKDNGDGTYKLSFSGVAKIGKYLVAPLVADELVKDAPFQIYVAPGGFDLSKTGVDVPNPSQAGRRGPKVSVRDNQGNLREGCDDKVEADLTPKIKIPNVKARSNGDGTYEIDYPPNLLPGNYEMDIRVNGQDVPKSPFNANVTLKELSPEQSQALKDIVPEAAATYERMLLNATEAERESIVASLKKLAGK